MEIIIKVVGYILQVVRLIAVPILALIFRKHTKKLPPIKNDLLKMPAIDLAEKIRNKKVTSEVVVKAFVDRIREVNPIINAVVDERFGEAIAEAKKADKMVEESSPLYLLQNYPLLGVPFSVKESLGVKGLTHIVGSLARVNEKATKDADSVLLLRGAGAIPICVTNTPEWCMSWESFNHVHGRTYNPYDLSRTSGGSSGGEAALIAAGGSVFGPGSDIAGSIRVPSLFNGIFGHKPTAGVVSIEGHFPYSTDVNFKNYLAIGPMARYAKDLMPLLHILSDRNPKLKLEEPFLTKNIKIYYKYDNDASFEAVSVDQCLTDAMNKALQHFRGNGLAVNPAQINLSDCYNIGVALFIEMEDVPDLLGYKKGKKRDNCLWEMTKSLAGKSEYTFAALCLVAMRETKSIIAREKINKYIKEFGNIRQRFINMLGDDGVLFIPTYNRPAVYHYESLTLLSGVIYTKFFNLLGFPATHVPMGVNKDGLPVGFQVVAAPYQDRLCLSIACEIEHAFGGWVPPC